MRLEASIRKWPGSRTAGRAPAKCNPDEGKGIPKEKLKDIFARYSRFDDANGGFGIGLNIVKMICDEYSIEINVESEIKRGTKFELKWEK